MRKMKDAVKKTFLREGPIEVDHFVHVAEKYNLPKPKFDDPNTKVAMIASDHDILYLG